MSEVKFLADSMLGKLAKWLRLMGFHTEYADSEYEDNEIIERCRKENLVLLSRDKELCSRYPNSIYIESDNYIQQLKEIIPRYHPDESLYFSRCPVCNGEVEKLKTSSYAEKLPESVRERFDYIFRCRGCGKVYWEGSHFEAILGTIRGLESEL